MRATEQTTTLLNFVGGEWVRSRASETLPVTNPASGEAIARVALTPTEEVGEAVEKAHAAFREWRRTPVGERIQPLFRFKMLLEAHLDELARLLTEECGKTRQESLGELRRGIENVEVACGAPLLMQGWSSEDIARGVDEHLIRQPLGVVAAITPFNFPAMIPLWFLPYAVATGNCFLLKPSEKVPLTTQRLFQLAEEAGFPAGVLSLLNGGKETVDALLDHPLVRAISFVGSTPVARYIYTRASANGKRAQCQGGAKNPVVIMPDADLDSSTRILADSAFGCAGQRCLAASVAITVGEARAPFSERIAEAASERRVGYGLDAASEMGPVISADSKTRIEGLIEQGVAEGARLLVDGRGRAGQRLRGWLLALPDDPGRGQPAGEDSPHRDLRAGALPDARGHARAGHRVGQRAQLWQHGLHLHGGAGPPRATSAPPPTRVTSA